MKRKYIDFRKRNRSVGVKLNHLIRVAQKLASKHEKTAIIYLKPGKYTKDLILRDNVCISGETALRGSI